MGWEKDSDTVRSLGGIVNVDIKSNPLLLSCSAAYYEYIDANRSVFPGILPLL